MTRRFNNYKELAELYPEKSYKDLQRPFIEVSQEELDYYVDEMLISRNKYPKETIWTFRGTPIKVNAKK